MSKMPIIKGRCPECWKVMLKWSDYVIYDFKRYTFPFKIWYCDKHGVYKWSGTKHKLVNLTREAISIEPSKHEGIKHA